MATPPQLTPEQRTAALAKAAEARAARAELKNQLKNGSVSIREALASTSVTVGKLKVVSLLESLPGVGKVKARKIMEDIGIADNRRVQGLGAVRSSHCSINSASEAMAASEGTADPLIIVISGPGGVGKGTIVNALVERDPNLWFSRSWTTRASVPGSPIPPMSSPTATLRASHRRGWLSGMDEIPRQLLRHPDARARDGRDVVLEIEVDGASRSRSCTETRS